MSQQLLSSPFLLHIIFLELPQQDLLLVQCVCRTWRDTIQGSKALLAALFLHPGPPGKQPQTASYNPLLQARFPSFFDSARHSVTGDATKHCMGPWYSTDWAKNIRPWPEDPTEGWYSKRPPSAYTNMLEVINDIRLDPTRTAAYRRPEASWRKMLPCSPAPTRLQICEEVISFDFVRHCKLRTLDSVGKDNDTAGNSRVGNQTGLTFGFIYDVVVDAWFHDRPLRTISLQLDWFLDDDTGDKAAQLKDIRYRRQKVRRALPDVKIGDRGCVLIWLEDFRRGDRAFLKRFKEEFAINSDVVQAWDQEVDFDLG